MKLCSNCIGSCKSINFPLILYQKVNFFVYIRWKDEQEENSIESFITARLVVLTPDLVLQWSLKTITVWGLCCSS